MQKTSCFDAAVEFSYPKWGDPLLIRLCVGEISISAFLRFFEDQTEAGKKIIFVQVHSAQPLSLKWKDMFMIKSPEDKEIWGKGTVLDPFAAKIIRRQNKRRLKYLKGLLGGEKEMFLSVVQFKGIQGAQENEILRFGHHSRSSLLELSEELETEGRIRILGFSPLFVICQAGIAFLCENILNFLAQFHEKHPGESGLRTEKIQKRFDVHFRILTLCLKHLKQTGQIKKMDDCVALSGFEMALLPGEEKILERLEKMYLEGKFQSVSLNDLQKSFRLSPKRLNKMLTLLTERKKIVLGRDGFILHSRWLDDIIQKLRDSGKRELTISEFKDMTGLTRKYAIPLLEFLDQMGVTRRRGAIREIL